MKNGKTLMVLSLFGALICLGACNNKTPTETVENETKWTITFNSNGGSSVSPIQVVDGQKATKPANPTKAGYTFDAWYQDSILVTPFSFDRPITADWTLYAGWTLGGEQSSESNTGNESNNSETSSEVTSSDASDTSTSSEEGAASEWYVVGTGSFVNGTEWNTSGGVNLLDNTANTLDPNATGEFYKTVTFASDDLWKITNGTVWVQMNCLDNSCPVIANGDITFVSDGNGGNNAKVVTPGSYTLYFKTYSNANSAGTTGYSLWVEKA